MGSDLRFQIPDFRKMASCRAERGEKGVRLGTRTPSGDRRFQIADFRDGRRPALTFILPDNTMSQKGKVISTDKITLHYQILGKPGGGRKGVVRKVGYPRLPQFISNAMGPWSCFRLNGGMILCLRNSLIRKVGIP
jgi:hypothetical protein